jgi:hypothetical protein
LTELCDQFDVFPEKRFRFIVEWDPASFLHLDDYERLPLHYAADIVTIQGCRMVFGYGILYYLIKTGISLLFKKDEYDKTPFQIGCSKHGRDEVMRVIEDTLILHFLTDNSPPLNAVEALITAAIDKNIHSDCVYVLFRRQPDVLTILLLGSINNNNNNNDGDGNDNE